MSTMAWPRLLHHALHDFAIPPKEFWRLSVVEWCALHAGQNAYADQKTLRRLMNEYPDEKNRLKNESS